MPTLKHTSDTFELLDRHPFMEFPQYRVHVPDGDDFTLVDPANAAVLKDGEFVVKTVTSTGLQAIRRVTSDDITALGDQVSGASVAFSLLQVHGMPGRTDLQIAKAMPVVNEAYYRFRYKLVAADGDGDTIVAADVGKPCTLALADGGEGLTAGNVYLKVAAEAWAVAVVDAVDDDGWVQFRKISPTWVPAIV